MQLSKNFTLEEFACHDGTCVPDSLMNNVKLLAQNLQVLRDFINKPIKINSGYRTPAHNARLHGASKSQHLLAQAADIVVQDTTPAELAQAIQQLIAAGKMKEGGLGRYKTFTHYDVRGKRARWKQTH